MKNYKKISAAALAAVLAFSVPIAGAANGAVSVVASAEESMEYEPIKYEIDENGTRWGYLINEDGETVTLGDVFFSPDEIVIPATFEGKKVTKIGRVRSMQSVFEKGVASVKIPDGVTTIGEFAFEWCANLSDVDIPNSVTTIGRDAFSSCSSLKGIKIPNGVTTIEQASFSGTAIENVTIPDGVTWIKAEAFSYCEQLKTVTIPSSVKVIDMFVFDKTPVETIYYGGTKAEWDAIKVRECDGNMGEDYWSTGLPYDVKVVYANVPSTGDPTTSDPTTSEPTTSYPTTSEPTASDPETSEPTSSEPTTSEPTTSDPTTSDPATSDPTDTPVTPGDTGKTSDTEDKQETLTATLKNVDSESGLSGEELEKQLFGDSGWTWAQTEKIEFTADKLFSVQYTAADGTTKTLGEQTAARAEDDGIWNTAWTLDTSLLSKDKPFVKLIAKDGTADITAKVYIKKGAEKPSNSDQKPTGIALAIAPVVLAAGAVIVISKKRK